MPIDASQWRWINPPRASSVSDEAVEIVTEPRTDLWQRTYYGFRHDDAPALLLQRSGDFTFSVKADFAYRGAFDQCGVVVYEDSEHWCKACVEYEDGAFSRLGSVVTNHGYSDWATSDIATPTVMWYRLSRRGPDFLVESSSDGRSYQQMRIFHLHVLGETTPEMGAAPPPLPTTRSVAFGLFACSPADASFTARFTELRLDACSWLPHPSG